MNFLAPRDLAITISAEAQPSFRAIEAVWTELERRADGSFFTSWTWIGAWLSTFHEAGEMPEVRLLTARAGETVVGLALVGERTAPTIWNRRKVAALHQSGVPDDDAIFIEYNDFLLDRRCAVPVREALLAFIAREMDGLREFRLSGVIPAMRRSVEATDLPHRVLQERPCPWIDLAKVPPGLSGYLAILSKNSRQQIQRSLRLFCAEGPVILATARDIAEGGAMMGEMMALHQRSWRERKGHGGAFASARFTRFVARLVAAGLADGSVQLLRASAGEASFGFLLNFVYRGHVYAYQSGFAYREDNRYRPGLVAHALAAVRAREQGLRAYHFMAGEGRYKSSLANADEHLIWMVLRHDTLISRAEDMARRVRRRIGVMVHGSVS